MLMEPQESMKEEENNNVIARSSKRESERWRNSGLLVDGRHLSS